MRTRILIRNILVVGFVLCARSACAQSIRVLLTNNHEVCFSFADLPVLTHKDGFARIETKATKVEYPIDDIRCISKCDAATAIDGYSVKSKGVMSKVGTHILLSGFASCSKGYLYNTNGIAVSTIIFSTGGCASVDMSSLPCGIYIVSVEGSTFKIENK